MMLVQLPAMDTVPALSLPSWDWSARVPAVAYQLANPSVWLTILASLVILSSLRAALLFFRTTSSVTARKGSRSFIPGLSSQQTPEGTSSGKGSTPTPTAVSAAALVMQDKADEKKMSSMFWGLVKWDTLPAFPLPRRAVGAVMSETERGRWQQQDQSLRILGTRRRSFDSPVPAIYQTEVPVSMAKMIMSRHTFRRPTSRPPPVRSANAPQYQKKLPSMV